MSKPRYLPILIALFCGVTLAKQCQLLLRFYDGTGESRTIINEEQKCDKMVFYCGTQAIKYFAPNDPLKGEFQLRLSKCDDCDSDFLVVPPSAEITGADLKAMINPNLYPEFSHGNWNVTLIPDELLHEKFTMLTANRCCRDEMCNQADAYNVNFMCPALGVRH